MAPGVVRIVQFNAGSLLEPAWSERRFEIVAWLERLQPDVVCLQEIWQNDHTANTAGWIAGQMSDSWHWHFEGRPFGSQVWSDPSMRFGSAVLSRWPVQSARYYALPIADHPEDDFVTGIPWELLHANTAGLDVYTCHLAAAPTHGRHRRVQVLAIDELIRASRGDLDATPPLGRKRAAMPPILCGDFNAEPDSDEIRFLCSLAVLDGRTTYYQDAWRVAGNGPGYTQDWRTNPIAAAMNIPRKRIDYIFVGDPFQRAGAAGRIVAADLAFHESLTGLLASDHVGLVADISWPDRPD